MHCNFTNQFEIKISIPKKIMTTLKYCCILTFISTRTPSIDQYLTFKKDIYVLCLKC